MNKRIYRIYVTLGGVLPLKGGYLGTFEKCPHCGHLWSQRGRSRPRCFLLLFSHFGPAPFFLQVRGENHSYKSPTTRFIFGGVGGCPASLSSHTEAHRRRQRRRTFEERKSAAEALTSAAAISMFSFLCVDYDLNICTQYIRPVPDL